MSLGETIKTAERMLFKQGPPWKPPLIEIRDKGESTYEYEFPSGKTKVKLGRGRMGNSFVHTVEVVWPSGAGDCPNTISQKIKRTTKYTYADGRVQYFRNPEPGGQEGTRYVEDTGSGGQTAQERSRPQGDGNKSYWDGAGPQVYQGTTKIEHRAYYKITLLNCLGVLLECWQFTLTVIVELQENGEYKATTNEMTPPKKCE